MAERRESVPLLSLAAAARATDAGNAPKSERTGLVSGFDPHEWLDLLRRQAWLICLAAVVCALAGGASAWGAKPQFAATATVLTQPRAGSTSDGGDVSSYIDPNRFITTEVQIGLSDVVRTRAQKILDVPDTSAGALTVVPQAEANVLKFTVTAGDAKTAAAYANAYATGYMLHRHEELSERLRLTVADLDKRIADLRTQLDQVSFSLTKNPFDPLAQANERSLVARITSLAQSNDQLRLFLSTREAGAQLLTPAVEPTAPLGSTLPRATELGLLVGLLLGIVLAVVRDMLDQRVRTKSLVESLTDSKVLGSLPHVDSNLYARECTRLRTALENRSRARGVEAPVLCPITPDHATDGVVSALGACYVRAGDRVVLVDADVTSPAFGQQWGVPVGPGLAEAVLNPLAAGFGLHAASHGQLSVVPVGKLAADSAGMISRPVSSGLLDAWLAQGNVLIRGSAVIGGAEPIKIEGGRGSAVLLVRQGHALRQDVSDAASRLELAGIALMGVVFYDAPTRSGGLLKRGRTKSAG